MSSEQCYTCGATNAEDAKSMCSLDGDKCPMHSRQFKADLLSTDVVSPEQQAAEVAFDELVHTMANGDDPYYIALAIVEVIQAEIALSKVKS